MKQRLPSAMLMSSSRCWRRRKNEPKDKSEPRDRRTLAAKHPKCSAKENILYPKRKVYFLKQTKTKHSDSVTSYGPYGPYSPAGTEGGTNPRLVTCSD